MTSFWPTFLSGLTFGVLLGAATALGVLLKCRESRPTALSGEGCHGKEKVCLDCNTVHGIGEPCPTCGRMENSLLIDRVRGYKQAGGA